MLMMLSGCSAGGVGTALVPGGRALRKKMPNALGEVFSGNGLA